MSIKSLKNTIVKKVGRVFGSGLVTGASDDDPSVIATKS